MMDETAKAGTVAAIGRSLAAVLLVTGALAGLSGRAAPTNAQDATTTAATVRVVHASPGAPNLDVLIDGQVVVKHLAFGSATDYVAVPAGDHKIQMTPTGQGANAALIDADLKVDGDHAYIFVALNRLKDIEGKLLKVDLDSLEQGKARMRVLHASPDAGKVDVALTGGDKLFGGVDFKDTTDYKNVDAGLYSLDVKDNGGRILLTAQNVNLADGEAYDIVILGQIADNSLALLPLATVVAEPCTRVLGLDGGTEDACVRIVHASPGGASVDVYLSDSPVAKGVAFAKVTDFVAVPAANDHKLQVTAAGGTPGDSDLLNASLDFDGRTAYEVVITGNPDDLKATTAQIDLSPLANGQARVRVVHASPDAGKVDVVVADGPKLFGGVNFRAVTDYKSIDAGSYTLQIKKGDTVALAGDVVFDVGTVYDVIVIGRTADNSLALLVISARAPVRQGGAATPASLAPGTPLAGTAEATVVNTTAAAGKATVVATSEAVAVTPTP